MANEKQEMENDKCLLFLASMPALSAVVLYCRLPPRYNLFFAEAALNRRKATKCFS